MVDIEIKKSLNEKNDEKAAKMREMFSKRGVFVMNIMGSPGAGKTTLLENILPKLSARFRTAVIEGDLATDNDAKRIEAAGVRAEQINTNGACHLDSSMVYDKVEKLPVDELDLIIIENVGNLVCPISFDLGEDYRVVVMSTAEGQDKPEKYPNAVLKTNALVITKTDIAPYVGVDAEKMKGSILTINPKVEVFFASMADGKYQIETFVDEITKKIAEKNKK